MAGEFRLGKRKGSGRSKGAFQSSTRGQYPPPESVKASSLVRKNLVACPHGFDLALQRAGPALQHRVAA